MNGHRGMATVGIPVGETVEQALRRLEPELVAPNELPSGAAEARWVARLARLLSEPINLEALLLGPQDQDGSTPSVWVQRDNPQTVDQVLGQMHIPPPAPIEPAAVPAVVQTLNTWLVPVPMARYEEPPPRPAPSIASEDAFAERLLRAWRWIAGGLAVLAILMILTAIRALLPKSAPPEAAPAIAMPSDNAYLAEIGQELEGRCVTWGSELRDAEELLAGAGMDPVRLSFKADEIFAGTRGRPRLAAEGRLRDSQSPSPLRAQAVGGVTVRRYHDRPIDPARGGGVLRSIEATW